MNKKKEEKNRREKRMNIIINLKIEQKQQQKPWMKNKEKKKLIKYSMQLRTFTKSEMILFLPVFRWSSTNHGFDLCEPYPFPLTQNAFNTPLCVCVRVIFDLINFLFNIIMRKFPLLSFFFSSSPFLNRPLKHNAHTRTHNSAENE